MKIDTLLAVEDDPGDIFMLERALRRAGIANPLVIVRDGEAAIDYLAGQGDYADRERFPLPTVMLLDLKLPKRSGLEVLAWLRDQPGLKRLRVVVLTSSRESPDVNRAHDLGVSSYLVKPVDMTSLVERLAALNLFLVVMAEKPSLDAGWTPQI